MADVNKDKYSKPATPRTGQPPKAPRMQISCRATNPLSLQDDLGKVFLDENQAKATTATRLFRNEELFAATRMMVDTFLKSSRSGRFAMWSTGCSSGEEVYSMAMIALSEFTRHRKPPQLEAFGTDINRNRIQEARDGVYLRPSKDAFSPNYWRLVEQYTTMQGGEVHMNDQLRAMCKFMLFDMRNRPKKHTFHFIVCNHVLQYYDVPGQKHIIGNLISVLKPGGHLYLEGATEHSLLQCGLSKLPNNQNLYIVAEKENSGGLSSPLFKK